MRLTNKQIEMLGNPEGDGVVHVPRFLDESHLREISKELDDPSRIVWRDTHETYTNKRGLKIVQNHDTYALKYFAGTKHHINKIPHVYLAAFKMAKFVRSLGEHYPSLENWQADELCLHKYNEEGEVGLSRHKDHTRFIGVIAIASLRGESTLSVSSHDGGTGYYSRPGDLTLLRAPGLVESDEDLRPEHAVYPLSPGRISLMVRANAQPDHAIPGFVFENWEPKD